MKSVMLSCEEKGWLNRTLLWKNLTRFWPLWAVYFAALFFSCAMPMINFDFRLMDGNGKGLSRLQILEEYRYLIRDGMETAVILGVIFGCLFAMAFFSYLMNRRSVGMIHALPLRREGLFVTNVLSGVICVVIPALAVFFIALGAEASKGVTGAGDLALWLLVTVSVTLFFFAFGVFCAMFTGNLLALPVFYGILNVLVLGMEVLLQYALEVLWRGYQAGDASALAEWLTPVIYFFERVGEWEVIDSVTVGKVDTIWVHDLSGGAFRASAYAIVFGLLFFLLAFLVYRARQMERAEDLVTVAWVRPIFRYGLGVCTGFALGEFLAGNFFDWGAWGLVLQISLCAALGGFVGQMLLKKTLRVLHSGWKGSLVLGLCVCAVLCGLKMDVVGYQGYVPAAEEVVSVRVRGVWSSPYDGAASLGVAVDDPEQVERVIAIHRWVTEHLERLEWDTGNGTSPTDRIISDSKGIRFSYQLKNGTTVKRSYDSIPIWEEELRELDSFAALLTEFIEQPEVLWSSYFYDDISAENAVAVGGILCNLESGREEYTLEREEAQLLWEAVREDINAGRYHRYLIFTEEQEENVLAYELDLDLYGVSASGDTKNGDEKTVGISIHIRIQKTANATVAALEKLGLPKTE